MAQKKKNSKAQRAQQAKIAAAKGETVVKTKKPAKEIITYQKYVKKSPIAEFFKKNWKLIAIVLVIIAALVAGGIFLGQSANKDDEVSKTDVSATDLEWPINKYTLLVPEPKYDLKIIEYAEDILSSSDAAGGTAESFYILITDFAADDVILYLEDLHAAGYNVQGPDPTLAASGIYLYIAEGEKASMGIYLYGDACMLSIIPGTITEEGIQQ